MRYNHDTEFYEAPVPAGGVLVQLISLGLVADDGRELYAENSAFDWDQPFPDTWLHEHVRPHLRGPADPGHLPPDGIRDLVRRFVGPDPEPEFWAWVASYDWVAFMGLFGQLVNRPAGWPIMCLDLKQAAEAAGMGKDQRPPMTGNEHDPLDDARWNVQVARQLWPART
jgi:hypothetical protein